jgi:hypothetical protein
MPSRLRTSVAVRGAIGASMHAAMRSASRQS